ncbi:MAG: cytochrome c [Candidatus Sulfobium sp.]|jgi:hypothetical protein
MKKSLLVLSMIFIAGCLAGRPTPIPGASSPAARLYVEKCGPCHSVPHPKRHTFEEWRHIIIVMKERMESKGMTFTPEERKIVLGYLKQHSR